MTPETVGHLSRSERTLRLRRKTEQVIARLARHRATALVRRDVEMLRRLLAPDFVYTTANGNLLKKGDYIQTFVLDPSVRWRSQKLTNVRVRVWGDAAVLVAKVHDVAKFGPHVLDADFRTTQVYVRRAGHWQYLAGHTSSLAGGSKAAGTSPGVRRRA